MRSALRKAFCTLQNVKIETQKVQDLILEMGEEDLSVIHRFSALHGLAVFDKKCIQKLADCLRNAF